jgi:plasmid stability protein
MATLYVENVLEELYDALRKRARGERKSISAEVLELLAEHIPTEKELARRRALFRQALKIQRTAGQPTPGRSKLSFPSCSCRICSGAKSATCCGNPFA